MAEGNNHRVLRVVVVMLPILIPAIVIGVDKLIDWLG